jgi:hypothetical protein
MDADNADSEIPLQSVSSAFICGPIRLTNLVEDIPASVDPKCGINGSCGAVIYQPNRGAAYVEQHVLGRFNISVTSSKVYP